MKVAIALFALVAIAAAAPAGSDSEATVLKYDNENIGVDGFNFAVDTSNGISHEATGTLINEGSENAAIAVRGKFQHKAPDGVVYTVNYVADENGYQPSFSYSQVL